MTTEAPVKHLRDGNAAKRAAILTAARELFLGEGVEHTSMDVVATHAAVSKRTVYDYFGDKRSLLLAVIEEATETVHAFLLAADGRYFGEAAGIATVADLERALVGFATELGRTVIAAPDYIIVERLTRENAALLPELAGNPRTSASEQLVADRLAQFAAQGLLDAPGAALAAAHFKALTISLAINDTAAQRSAGGEPDTARIDMIMTEGSRAFMRAYRHRD